MQRSTGSNLETMRRDNLSTVLRQVHAHGTMSRSDLVAETGMRRSTIGQLVTELAALGLVDDGRGKTAGEPGRPSFTVRPRWEGAVAVAVEIAVDTLAVAALGIGGEIRHKARVDRATDRTSVDATFDDVAALVDPVLSNLREVNVVGIGVSYFGVVRSDGSYARLAPNIGWRDLDVGAHLRSRLTLEPGSVITVANDADCGALAESIRGVGAGVSDLVYLSGEVGIGAGIVADGRPVTGLSGYAGEAGHMKVNPSGRSCNCGGSGCWETEVGARTIASLASAPEGASPRRSAEEVIAKAAEGDRASRAAVGHAARWLGIGIANLANLLDPEMVIVAGLLADLFRVDEDTVRKHVEANTLPAVLEDLDLSASAYGADASLLGAGEKVLQPIIADPRLGRARPLPG